MGVVENPKHVALHLAAAIWIWITCITNKKQQQVGYISTESLYICDLSRKNPSYAFLISLTFNSCQAAILYRMPTSFGNQEVQ